MTDARAPALGLPDAGAAGAYTVLARKYRPQTFADLIGQETMVRTLTNAFAAKRIAHAFMLTGVRGVGKTTTARLLARALNYRRGKADEPTIALDPPGELCPAIAAGRHQDVLEMDAASRTGVGDIRELLESVRYGPVEARCKVYIIDEVHMLSTAAFNALLKTLEEPPSHAKFIFATTEIRKVPVTVLSRCQRFDLRRVDPDALVAHLAKICKLEKAKVAEDGLKLIARAAEGSVRDALSLLDQAIVQSGGAKVAADAVREMLGLADRARSFDLFAKLAKGDAGAALAELASQHAAGADPVAVLRDLLDHCHDVTRAKAVGEAAQFAEAADQIARIRALAAELSMGGLARLWQMLLKAYDEARAAPDPLAAVEMALIRIAHAAGLPPPEEAARLLADAGGAGGRGDSAKGGGGEGPASKLHAVAGGARPGSRVTLAPSPRIAPAPEADPEGAETAPAVDEPAPEPQPEPASDEDAADVGLYVDAALVPGTLEAIGALVAERRDLMLLTELERFVRPVRVEPGRLVFEPAQGAPVDLAPKLARRLMDWTGAQWLVLADKAARGGETLGEKRRRERAELIEEVSRDPAVKAALALWPGAEIVEVREREGSADAPKED